MTFLYVGNGDGPDISAFDVDVLSGSLVSIGTFAVPATGPGSSSPLAVSIDRRLLFVGLRTEPWLACSFAIDASGHLDYLGSGPLADNPCYISCDRTGRFLLSASYQGNKVSVNAIDPDGVVCPPHQVIDTLPRSHSILVDAANRYALSACLGGDVVYQWRFDAESGRLTPNDPLFVSVKEHSGPRHLVFHPNGRFVYLLNEYTATICVYDYDQDSGIVHEKQLVDALTPTPAARVWASDIHVSPDGRFLYAAERGSGMLAMLKIDAEDGTLSLLGHVLAEKQPRGFAIDPTSHFLYCAGQLSTRLSSYAIDRETGALRKRDDYLVGGNPNWVEIVEFV